MSMMLVIRDTAALFDLEKGLQGVRAAQLRAGREGKPMTPLQLEAAEARVMQEIKNKHYCLRTRLSYLPSAQANAITDQADFDGRMYADMEAVMFDAHHRILSLPCVGDLNHDDAGHNSLTARGRK
jgi:hypothetical protein